MTITLNSLSTTDVALLSSSHVVATLDTLNSRYLLVKRAAYCLVVKDGDRNGVSPVGIGEPMTGTSVEVVAGVSSRTGEPGHIIRLWDGQSLVFQSSWLTGAYVLEN